MLKIFGKDDENMDRYLMAGSIVLMVLAIVFFALGNFDASRDYMIMALVVGHAFYSSAEH